MRVGVRRGEHLARARVFDHVGAARTGGAPAQADAGRQQAATSDREDERPSHLSRIFSPMKSDVECTFGFSCSRVATGTPDLEEITPKVSPAWTVQNRFAATAVVVVPPVVVVTTCFRGAGDTDCGHRRPRTARLEAGADQHDGDRRSQQKRRRGDVAAPVVGEHYQPEAAQISCLSRAASAPAASR